MRFTKVLPSLLFVLLTFAQVSFAELAVVVQKGSPVTEVTLQELKRVVRLEQQRFKTGGKIVVVIPGPGLPERQILLNAVLGMKEQESKAFWLAKVFKGDATSGPKFMVSSEAARRLVSQLPSALGFIDSSAVTDAIQVVKVDGKGPGEPGYPLAR